MDKALEVLGQMGTLLIGIAALITALRPRERREPKKRK
jgi:hypothetical protein